VGRGAAGDREVVQAGRVVAALDSDLNRQDAGVSGRAPSGDCHATHVAGPDLVGVGVLHRQGDDGAGLDVHGPGHGRVGVVAEVGAAREPVRPVAAVRGAAATYRTSLQGSAAGTTMRLYGPLVWVHEMDAGLHCRPTGSATAESSAVTPTCLGERRDVDGRVSRKGALEGHGGEEKGGKDSGVHGEYSVREA
jgi:hypothetical protein